MRVLPLKWGYPFIAGWFISWKIPLKWMRSGGTTILGNLQMISDVPHCDFTPSQFAAQDEHGTFARTRSLRSQLYWQRAVKKSFGVPETM